MKLRKMFSIALGLMILAAIGAIAYVTASPPPGERFTEFYILGLSGKAIDYPRELKLGEEGKVIVGIINQELETVSYRVVVRVEGVKTNEIEPIVLEHGEEWEDEVSFTPLKAGNNQKVEFLLFKNEEIEPCLEPLYLWLNAVQ